MLHLWCLQGPGCAAELCPVSEQGMVSAPQHPVNRSAGSSPSFFLRYGTGCLGPPGSGGGGQWFHSAIPSFGSPMAACWGVLCHTGAGPVFLHAEAGVLLPSLIFHVVLFLDIMSPLCYLWFHVLSWLPLWERSPCGGEAWRNRDVRHRHPMGLQGASTHPRDMGRAGSVGLRRGSGWKDI